MKPFEAPQRSVKIKVYVNSSRLVYFRKSQQNEILLDFLFSHFFVVPQKVLLRPLSSPAAFNSFRPDTGRKEKINLNVYFTLLSGASKGLGKALKAFIKPAEAPQRSVKIKIHVNFYFNTAL